MTRRRVVAFALGLAALALPATADAQAEKTRRIGFLGSATPAGYAPQLWALRQGLRDLGWIEGKNLAIEYRWAEDRYERLPELAAELVRLKVDLIVTHGTPGSLAAKQATKTIPVVMAVTGDPVAAGIVASFARPGGNLTGMSFHYPEMMAKRLEVLKSAMPRLGRAGVLLNPDNPLNVSVLQRMEQTARALNVEWHQIEVRGPDEFAGAFSALASQRSEAVVVIDDGMLIAGARRLADLAVARRLPAIGNRELVEAGALMAYAVNFPEVWRRSAVFVDKILKGAKPADLPIEQAERLELIVNLKTAKALGLTLPQSLMQRADHFIQ